MLIKSRDSMTTSSLSASAAAKVQISAFVQGGPQGRIVFLAALKGEIVSFPC